MVLPDASILTPTAGIFCWLTTNVAVGAYRCHSEVETWIGGRKTMMREELGKTLTTTKSKTSSNYGHVRQHRLPISRPALVFAAHSQVRTSPDEVKKEIQRCYQLINKLGRGVVYLGSSRVKVAQLLDCTTWTGAGPGLMDAATRGALEAKKPVGGFKISKESGDWSDSSFHPYLPSHAYLTCRFFSARKHGLVDAVVRNCQSDMTAVVALPGGIGTLDEVFEILALIQLGRIGSKFPVPFLIINYDSFYSNLLAFMDDCERFGMVARGEPAALWKVCSDNFEAVEYLTEFYNLNPKRPLRM